MAFVKGIPKVEGSGRVKGSHNRKNLFSVHERLKILNYDLVGSILKDINEVDDPSKRARLHLELLTYCASRRAPIQVLEEQAENKIADDLSKMATDDLLKLAAI